MKKKFCKYCGGEIDGNRKCSKCGKQYFTWRTSHFIIAIMICASLILGYYCYSYYEMYQDVRGEVAYQTSLARSRGNLIDDLNKQISEQKNMISNYEKWVAFRTEAGEKYHKYDCYIITNNDGKIYYDTIYNLERLGYEPCKHCH